LVVSSRHRKNSVKAAGAEGRVPACSKWAGVVGPSFFRIPFVSLRDAIFTHPTMSEGLNHLLKAAPSKSMQK